MFKVYTNNKYEQCGIELDRYELKVNVLLRNISINTPAFYYNYLDRNIFLSLKFLKINHQIKYTCSILRDEINDTSYIFIQNSLKFVASLE